MKKLINIYTGNHRTLAAIEDQLKILTDVFSKDFNVIINNNKLLVNGLNIIIESFENPYTVTNLKKFKKENPETKFILILTEFFSTSLLTKSLNNFEKNYFTDLVIEILFNSNLNLILRSLVHYTNIFKLYMKRNYINYFKRDVSTQSNNLILRKIKKINSDLVNFLSKKIYMFRCLLFRTLEREDIKKIFEKISFKIFFKKRFNNLLKLNECFDEILSVHPNITKNTKKFLNKKSSTIYPYIPKVKFNKNISSKEKKIIITGNFSIYRKNTVENLKKIKNTSYIIDIGGFESNNLIKNYEYSLNIPQKKKWKFSSPMRIIRSISLGLIPLNYKIFNDHPIEKICIPFNEKKPDNFNKEVLKFKQKFKKNTDAYNAYAFKKNNSIKSIVKRIPLKKHNQMLKIFFIRSENPETIISFLIKTYVKNYKIYNQKETKKFFAINNDKKISKKIFNEIKDFKFKEYEIFNLKIKIIENFLKNTKLDLDKFYLIAKTVFYDFIYFNNKFFITKKGQNLENLFSKQNNIKSFHSFCDCINGFVILEKLRDTSQTSQKSFSFSNYILNLNSTKTYDVREKIKFSLIE